MSLASNFARSVKVELIAKLATSYEAYDGGTLIKNVAPHNVRDYFRKYASTARKFDHIENDDIYVGYVRISGRPEFLSAIVLAGEHAVAVSFDSETFESNDFLTLMAKKDFAELMTVAVQRAASNMKNSIAPTSVAAPVTTQPAVEKKGNSIGWILIAVFAIIWGAVFIIPMIFDLAPRGSQSYEDGFRPYSSGLQGAFTSNIPPGYEQKGAIIEGVTLGMADAIMAGIDDFNATYATEGMAGAVSKSIECLESAKSSSSIFEIDKCAAFDFTAQAIDSQYNIQYELQIRDYLENTSYRLNQAYLRFPEHNDQRMAAMKGQTAVVLRDMSF